MRVRDSLPLNLQAARARESTQAGSRDLPTGPLTRDLVLLSWHGRLSHTATAHLDPGHPGWGSSKESGFPYLRRRFADAITRFPNWRRGSPAYAGPCLAAGDLGCDRPGSSSLLLTTHRGSRSLLGGAGCPYRIVIAPITPSYRRLSFRTLAGAHPEAGLGWALWYAVAPSTVFDSTLFHLLYQGRGGTTV